LLSPLAPDCYGWPTQPLAAALTTSAPQAPLPATDYGGSAYGPSATLTTPGETAKKFQCLYPGCKQKPFGRSADLDRHIQKIHFPESQQEKYNCDYAKCQRSATSASTAKSGTAFTRRDHYRDHLREFHKEDLLKRGQRSGDVTDWLRKRHSEFRWWRCGKCLDRIYLSDYSWECPACRQVCERERQAVRLEKMEKKRAAKAVKDNGEGR
jgi:hypothetical protein